MKLEFSRQCRKIFKHKISRESVQWNLICANRKDGQTEGHNEDNSRFTQFILLKGLFLVEGIVKFVS